MILSGGDEMLREKLKNLDLKITELAEYMQVSRPTMYKFIECYDSHDFSQINPKMLKLFNYIDEHELIGKRNVVNYILTQLSGVPADEDEGEAETVKIVKNQITTNPTAKKSQFYTLCATGDSFDEIIPYLVRIQPLLTKKRLTSTEKELLQPYLTFKDEIKKTEE